MPKIPHPLAQCEAWLSEHPCPPDEPGADCINLWIMRAAGAFRLRRLPEDKAYALIENAMTRAQKQPREIERAIRKAYSSDASFNGFGTSSVALPPYDPDRLI